MKKKLDQEYAKEFIDMQKLINNRYMKECDKNKESSYFRYWNGNSLHGHTISQKLPVNKFEWIKDTSHFNEDLIKNYNEEND